MTVYAVDWDGTLVQDDKWPAQGDWLPGAQTALKVLLRHGKVVIYSLRISPYELGGEEFRPVDEVDADIQGIRRMLDEAGLRDVEIHTSHGKPAADYYIDNRAVEFDGKWGKVLKKLGVDKDVTPVLETYLKESQERTGIRVFDTGATRDTDEGKLELAWASGLFEGEGWITFDRKHPHLGLRSTDEDILHRFHKAVGGLGSVNGPYLHNRPKPGKPFWQWFASANKAREVISLFYVDLGSRKQARAREVFGEEFCENI